MSRGSSSASNPSSRQGSIRWNRDGEVTRVETERYLRYPLEGHLYLEVVARDGLPLDADAHQEEKKRKANFVQEARRHAARGEKYEPDARSIRFDRQLIDRYQTILVGTEEVQGHSCWVIRIEPRAGRLPDARSLDKALNRSTGRLWITQNGHHLARIAFQMQRPVRYLWGVLATLRSVEGQLEYEAVQPEFWMPKRLDLHLDVRVFFGLKAIRRRIRNDWVAHRPVVSNALRALMPDAVPGPETSSLPKDAPLDMRQGGIDGGP